MSRDERAIAKEIATSADRISENTELVNSNLVKFNDFLARMENNIMALLDSLIQEVRENNEVISSAVALIKGLRDRVAALQVSAQNSGEVPQEIIDQIHNLARDLDTQTSVLANSMVENTPVAETETPAQPEPPVVPESPSEPVPVEPAPPAEEPAPEVVPSEPTGDGTTPQP
jgi:hypothetical protein